MSVKAVATHAGYHYPALSKIRAGEMAAAGKPPVEIAQAVGCSLGTVYAWARVEGWRLRGKSPKAKNTAPVPWRKLRREAEESIRSMWAGGYSAEEIAGAVKTNRGHIGSVLGIEKIGRLTVRLSDAGSKCPCPRCGCRYALKKRAISKGRTEIQCKFCRHHYADKNLYVRWTRRERLKAAGVRREPGMSVEEAAKAIGVSRTTYWRYRKESKKQS